MARKFDIERWAKLRAMGSVKFVLIWGVLIWGGTNGLVISGVRWAMTGRPPSAILFGASFTVCLLGGVLFGTFLWSRNERTYRAEMSKIKDVF